jgi:hypothetical protein
VKALHFPTSKKYLQPVIYFFLLFAIAFLGFWWLKISTFYGLGLVNDSYAYVSGAINILKGNGYSQLSGGGEVSPITHFPPMFSILLALVDLLKIDILFAARLVVLSLFGLNAILVGITLLAITRRYSVSLLGAFLSATSGVFLRTHSMLMSEPLFITLSLISSLCLIVSFLHKRRTWLLIAGVLAGCATLTRYAGLASIFTALLTIALFRRKVKLVLSDALFYVLGALPLIISWGLRNQLLTGTVANRQLLWHLPSWSTIELGLFNFLAWIFPRGFLSWLQAQKYFAYALTLFIGFVFLWLVITTFRSFYRYSQPDGQAEAGEKLYIYHLIYVVVYLGAILATMIFFDASTRFENRILAPMEVSLLIVILGALAKWSERRPLYQKVLVITLLLMFTWFWAREGRYTVELLGKDGQGYASLTWKNSPTIEYIRNLPPEKIIYTNKNTGVFLQTGRNSYRLLSRTDPVTLKPRDNYEDQLAEIHQNILSQKAVLIFFGPDEQTEPEDRAWLEDLRSGLTMFEKFSDSEVYDR